MKKILVIDDNMLMRKLISNIFNNKCYLLDEAANGSDGLEKIIKNNYDLVITDILMPEMEGIELIRHTKRLNAAIRIIAITGGDPLYLSLAKKFGADHAFTKPLNYYSFKNTVEQFLDENQDLKKVG